MLKGTERNDEKVTMLIKLEPDAPNTERYLRYLLEMLASRQPLTSGKLIEIHVRDGETPLPEFTEVPDDQSAGPHKPPRTAREAMYWRHVPPRKGDDAGRQILDTDRRREIKEDLIFDYTREALGGLCRLHGAATEEHDPLDISFKLTVLDPAKIEERAQSFDIPMSVSPAVLDASYSETPTFDAASSYLTWLGKTVPIEYSSKQFGVCVVSFMHEPSEFVSWDVVDEEVGEKNLHRKEQRRKSVYHAVRELNKKIRGQTKRDLFLWENQSFRRLA